MLRSTLNPVHSPIIQTPNTSDDWSVSHVAASPNPSRHSSPAPNSTHVSPATDSHNQGLTTSASPASTLLTSAASPTTSLNSGYPSSPLPYHSSTSPSPHDPSPPTSSHNPNPSSSPHNSSPPPSPHNSSSFNPSSRPAAPPQQILRRSTRTQRPNPKDYNINAGIEADSSAHSSKSSIFRQIEGVEHVSGGSAKEETWQQVSAPINKEVSTSGRGKSSRVVLVAQHPDLSTSPLPTLSPNIPILTYRAANKLSSSSASSTAGIGQSVVSSPPSDDITLFLNSEHTPALTNATSKISFEVYDYFIFRTPENYKNARLEAPNYNRAEKYEPKVVPVTVAIPGPGQDMVFDKGFVTAPSAPRTSQTKISLGRSSNHSSLHQVREREDRPEVEEVIPLKRTKRSSSRPSELLDALRDRDDGAGTLLDRISAEVPILETIMNWPTDQLGEQIAEDILWLSYTPTDLFCRAKASENIMQKEVEPLRKQVAAKDERIQDLESKLTIAKNKATGFEREAVLAKQAANRMKDVDSLARFLC
nr:hypothetical protein Iba_chr12bCG15310 [Ipomoea batatas]